MPKALATKDDNARVSPYSKSKPSKSSTSKSNTDKENADAKPTSKPKLSKAAAEIQAQYSDFRDIPLDEFDGEVPCYDDASVVRRKLNKLLTDKQNIPGTNKKWTQAGISKEMEELESRMGAVECHRNSTGPSPRSLGTFLKKKGKMGGGDSPAYYWGYVLLEKLRIWEGGKKSKAREEAEKERYGFPGGRVREDPDHCFILAKEGNVPPWEPEARKDKKERIQKFEKKLAIIRDTQKE